MQVQGVDIALMLESAMTRSRCFVQQGYNLSRFEKEESPILDGQEFLWCCNPVIREPVENVDKRRQRHIETRELLVLTSFKQAEVAQDCQDITDHLVPSLRRPGG